MDTVKLLTDIIKSEVCGAPLSVAPLTEETARELFALAKRHSLAHIVGDALCRAHLLPNGEAKAAFEKEAFAAICRYELMKKEIETLYALFEEAEIPYIPLKGTVLRGYYPAPWMRSSGDIDILVKPEDHDRAKELLAERGYRFEGETPWHANFETASKVHFELHSRLFGKTAPASSHEIFENVWQHAHPARNGEYLYEFSDAFFYLYHVAHMAKHYLGGGCGIRPFLDLWVLNARVEHDSDARAALLEEAGLTPFATESLALCDVWFSDGKRTPLLDNMERYVLSGGVYGTSENTFTVKTAKHGGRLWFILSHIFVSYRVLKTQYPSLQKHKWLFPFYQIRRWCRLIFRGSFIRVMRMLTKKGAIGDGTRQDVRAHLEELGF